MEKKSSHQTIYLESDEEITSVVDRLRKSEAKEIILVIPKGTALLQSIVNLKLLKKEAEKLQRQIFIVTTDKMGKNLAAKAGLIVRQSAREELNFSLRKKNLKDSSSSFSTNRNDGNSAGRENRLIKVSDIIRKNKRPDEDVRIKPINEKVVDEKQRRRYSGMSPSGKISKTSPVKTDKKKKMVILLPTLSAKFFLVFLAFCIITVFGAVFLVLPSAAITIIPKTEPLTLNLDVIVDKNIGVEDFQTNKIPGQIISIEKETSQEFPATGTKKVQERAKGIITVYNEWDSSSQILVKTTRFLSKEGKLFRTTKTVTVPGFTRVDGKDMPGTVDVEVVADKPGEDYNIGPTSFTIPGFAGTVKHSLIYGRSKEPIKGGIVGEVKIVSPEDIKAAQESLSKILQKKARSELKKEVSENLKLLEGSFYEQIIETHSSVDSGIQADKFTQFVKIRSSALVFKQDDLRNLIEKNLTKSIVRERRILNQTLKTSYGQGQINFDEGQMTVPVHIETVAVWEIKTDEIKKQIAGKNESELRNYLQGQSGIKRAKVSFWPFWVKRAPYSANKIKITVNPVREFE